MLVYRVLFLEVLWENRNTGGNNGCCHAVNIALVAFHHFPVVSQSTIYGVMINIESLLSLYLFEVTV